MSGDTISRQPIPLAPGGAERDSREVIKPLPPGVTIKVATPSVEPTAIPTALTTRIMPRGRPVEPGNPRGRSVCVYFKDPALAAEFMAVTTRSGGSVSRAVETFAKALVDTANASPEAQLLTMRFNIIV